MKCSVDGCEIDTNLKAGLCRKHYMRKRRTGDPTMVRPPGTGGVKSKHFMYGAWSAMKNRCHNPKNSSYPRYGGVGIYVCQRWQKDFDNFLADMGERPDGMTLDRIDPTGPYSPENCRWASPRTQRMNLSDAGRKRASSINSQKRKEYWRQWRKEHGRDGTYAERRRAGKLS